MAARPTKIGARDTKTGAWWVLWTDNVYREAEEKPVAEAHDDLGPHDLGPDGNSVYVGTGFMSIEDVRW